MAILNPVITQRKKDKDLLSANIMYFENALFQGIIIFQPSTNPRQNTKFSANEALLAFGNTIVIMVAAFFVRVQA
jgi:hypothetical protein